MAKLFTADEDDIIRAAFADCKTDTEISAMMPHRSAKTIKNRRHKLGLVSARKTTDWDVIDWSLTLPEIAARYGVSVNTLKSHKKKHGIRTGRKSTEGDRRTVVLTDDVWRMARAKARRSRLTVSAWIARLIVEENECP